MTEESVRTKLRHALSRLDSLPAMPASAQKLLALPLDSSEGEDQLLKIIEQDPQISAKIVGLANSPIMGVTRKISTVGDAAMLLGMTRVKSVAIGIASLSNFSKLPSGKNFKPQDLWIHSMTLAIVMRTIALEMPARKRPQEDHIFLAGLLHDIGFMALHYLDPEVSDELHHELGLQPKRPVVEIEMEALGMTHCYIGTQLAHTWHLPDEIIEVIEFHHQPFSGEVEAAGKQPMVRLLSLAEKLLPDFGISEHTGGAITDLEWLDLGISPDKAEEIIALTEELAMQAAQFGEY